MKFFDNVKNDFEAFKIIKNYWIQCQISDVVEKGYKICSNNHPQILSDIF